MTTNDTTPNAYEAAKPRPVLCQITVEENGESTTYDVIRKPNSLLISEMARIESGSPSAMAVIADFFEVTLGREAYLKFRQQVYRQENAEDVLNELILEVMEGTLGRPTKSS